MFDTTITDELLATTRAVRKRLDVERPVDPAVVLECIALAQQAPTGSNQQSWRWVVVTEPATRAALAELYRQGCLAHIEDAIRTETDAQTRRVYESALGLAQTIERVPVLVIPCIERRFDRAPLEDRLLRANQAQPPRSKGQGPAPASPANRSTIANNGPRRERGGKKHKRHTAAGPQGPHSAFAEELAKAL